MISFISVFSLRQNICLPELFYSTKSAVKLVKSIVFNPFRINKNQLFQQERLLISARFQNLPDTIWTVAVKSVLHHFPCVVIGSFSFPDVYTTARIHRLPRKELLSVPAVFHKREINFVRTTQAETIPVQQQQVHQWIFSCIATDMASIPFDIRRTVPAMERSIATSATQHVSEFLKRRNRLSGHVVR